MQLLKEVAPKFAQNQMDAKNIRLFLQSINT